MSSFKAAVAVAAFLVSALASTAHAVEYRLPGNCVRVMTQEVKADGSRIDRIEVKCEYSEAQRSRMAKEGR